MLSRRWRVGEPTLASDAASGGSATGTSLGLAVGGVAGNKLSAFGCPSHLPMPTDEVSSLYETVEGCASEYWAFLNPLPFTSDTDFCTLPGNAYIRAVDVRAKDGYQILMDDFLKKLRVQFRSGLQQNAFDPSLVPVVEAFSRQIRQCYRNYTDRFSTSKPDYCEIRKYDVTADYWRFSKRQGKTRVSIPRVLLASLRLIHHAEQLNKHARS